MIPAFSLIIPAFNEARRISGTLREALIFLERTSPESEVIVVDDGSTDETSEIVRRVFAVARNVGTRLIQHPVNQGKGAAVRLGLFEARREVALFSDADFSTPIEEAPKLLEPIFAGELDVAWRFLHSGAVTVLGIDDSDLSALEDLMKKYHDRPMDFADATLVHLARRESLVTVFTVDHDDFETYRISGRRRFRIVPER